MKYYIVKFNKDWADEFIANGFMVINEIEYNAVQKVITNDDVAEQEWCFGFGSNQAFEFDENIGDYYDSLNISEISLNDLKVLISIFGLDYSCNLRYGIVQSFSDLFESCSGEEVDEYFELLNSGKYKLL